METINIFYFLNKNIGSIVTSVLIKAVFLMIGLRVMTRTYSNHNSVESVWLANLTMSHWHIA